MKKSTIVKFQKGSDHSPSLSLKSRNGNKKLDEILESVGINTTPIHYVYSNETSTRKATVFTEHDKNQAVRIAELCLSSISLEERTRLKDGLVALLERWREETIELNTPKKKRTSKEKAQPWKDSLPHIFSPIDLYYHLEYTRDPSLKSAPSKFNACALLILISDEQKDSSLWPDMMREALLLASIQLETEIETSQMKGVVISKHLNSKKQREIGIKQTNLNKAHITERLRSKIHQSANKYRDKGISKRNFANLILKHEKFGLSLRQIQRYLKDYPKII